MSGVVIVGAGVAGFRTARALRKRGFAGDITLVGEEAHPPYDRPPLSKNLWGAEARLPRLATPEALADLDLDLRRGERVLALDTERSSVSLGSSELVYEHLVVASGASARRLAGYPGTTLRTWDDAQRLRRTIRRRDQVTIVGAGLIGCEVASSLLAAGVHVDVVDPMAGPMLRVLGPRVSALVQQLHQRHGLRAHYSTTVADQDGTCLALEDGTILRVDHLVHAIGSTPRLDWLRGSSLDIADGVSCDDRGRASVEGVHAVGDVARWAGHRAEHWSSAVEQAETVAADIMGVDRATDEVAYWWSDQFGVRLQGLGTIDAEQTILGTIGPDRRPLALFLVDERLVGAVGVSGGAALMRLRRHVATRTPAREVLADLETAGWVSPDLAPARV